MLFQKMLWWHEDGYHHQPNVATLRDVIQMFTKLLDHTYTQDLKSGNLWRRVFFLKETNPAEPIYESLKTGNMIITHERMVFYQCHDRRDPTLFLLQDFLFDESRSRQFLVNSMTVHQHSFEVCVDILRPKVGENYRPYPLM